MSLNILFWLVVKGLPGAPKPNVRVQIRRRIVQIHSKSAGIGAIVPIAATFQGTCAILTLLKYF